MNISEFVKSSAAALEGLYPPAEARNIVLALCRDRLGIPDYLWVTEPLHEIPSSSLPGLDADLRRLLRAEPLQYVLGHCEFCGRDFKVAPSVLIPRPETEELVAHALEMIGSAAREARATQVTAAGEAPERVRVLDLCTGSGCIAWSVLLGAPGSSVTAVDISENALAIARAQFSGDLFPERRVPRFVRADILDEQQVEEALGGEKFDVLVSNPPYVMEREKAQMRPNVLNYEPSIALFVSDDDPLVFYCAIARIAKSLGIPRGIVEINENLGEETAQTFRDAGYERVEILHDIAAKQRFVKFS